ncbi:putative periplasmic-binding protein [Caenispirillum salinarum AK4]|uniref:Thiamine pyrimidine synthase n=1 Tax=Caenispirillum salinarum AK4 TaxID=1238182 RepID=K9GU55_9PROT|nr:ABC transporter substrate-binding protein [Caenispirillum salinarum]EKV28677.1 putative periplasmic-binding protein [Caenispirillum salinarum AK4]
MPWSTFRQTLAAAGVAALTLSASAAALAQDALPIKFTLDWKFEGPSAGFLMAKQKGYFEEEGLDVSIDSGNGSSGAVTRVASGAYDIAMADVNSMIEFNASNPEQAMKAMFIVYNAPPFALFTLKESGIDSVEKMEGKTFGAPVFDSPRKLFPAFAQATGIDGDSVEWTSMDPALREPMLIRGDVDGISGFYFTSLLNLRGLGVGKEDLNIWQYRDAGLDLYGNGLIASPALMEENPEAVTGFLRAVVKGWQDVIADPEAGIDAVKERDPLIDEALELDRLMMAIENNVLTEEVKTQGMGGIDEARMQKAIDQVTYAFGIEDKPAVSDVFTSEFLPPQDERMLTATQ